MCVLLLIVCGLIEGHISPDPSYPLWSRLVIGSSWWFVAMCVITGRIWRQPAVKPSRPTPAAAP
jgi:hypothetical protein